MLPKKILIPAGILFSGICWYLSFDLSLNEWWPIWIAPIPVLYLSLQVKGGQAFVIAFLSLLIGRLSWLVYLLSVVPAPIAILYTLFLPLVFALLLLAVRKIILTEPPMLSMFAFPVLWTSFEILMSLFSRDGTIGSIAYTQWNFGPVVQLASVTGITGISFLVCFVPSAIVVLARCRRSGKAFRNSISLAIAIVVLAAGYGIIRLNDSDVHPGSIAVGLASIDERSYDGGTLDPRAEKERRLTELYLQEIRGLARQGAGVVLLPEKAIPVTDTTETFITGAFLQAAHSLGITIIAGYSRIKKDHLENRAWVLSPEGRLLTDYWKVKLFEGEVAEGFLPGKDAGIFRQDEVNYGVAICKDLDFEQYIRAYGRSQVKILYAPAWDFNRDGWLHSRMAMMRAVENGYTLVRNARLGRLTISDDRGRVLAESSSEGGGRSVLLGKAGPSAGSTLYSRWGDWFGYLNLLAACYFLFLAVRKKIIRPARY